jgi:carbon monoxide dehydrogenase subunit G
VAEVKETIEINAPLQAVYNQWTQFEEFPRFMEGVEAVRQVDDTHLHWVAEIGGRRREWDAEITYQEPDRRIAWRAIEGKYNSGEVTFEALGPDVTRVNVSMTYEREGLVETLGSALGADDRRVRGDLERFKELIEERRVETGAWRGEVREGEPQAPATQTPAGEAASADGDETAGSGAAVAAEVQPADRDDSSLDDERAPLFEAADTEQLRERWQVLQIGFVDDPRQMVSKADDLVGELMQRLTDGFGERRSALEEQWDKGDDVSTEDLRVVLTRYRSFFNRLLSA